MRSDTREQLRAIEGEIRDLECSLRPNQFAVQQPKLVALLERRAELRRSLDFDLEEIYGF